MTVELLVAALACWRVTSLFIREDGPFAIFMHIRSLTRRMGSVGAAFECPWCLSVWVGLICTGIVLMGYWWTLLPFALSAVTILVDKHVVR